MITLKRIQSFSVDHLRLQKGVYVSRQDEMGAGTVTTFDLRVTRPNEEPVMGTAEIHTIEHIGATYLRNHEEYGGRIIYFGPMGCRTGFYLILEGGYASKDVVPLVTEMFEFIRGFRGDIPGASAEECGNYLDMDLPAAKYHAGRYLSDVLYGIGEANLNYPR